MHPEKSVQETTKEADRDDIARRQETVIRGGVCGRRLQL
jgi:hypothetical protein